MIDAITTFWGTFLEGNFFSTLVVCLVAVTAVFLLYGCLVRPLICLVNKNTQKGVIPIFDKLLAVITAAFCIFQMSPYFLSGEVHTVEVPAEVTIYENGNKPFTLSAVDYRDIAECTTNFLGEVDGTYYVASCASMASAVDLVFTFDGIVPSEVEIIDCYWLNAGAGVARDVTSATYSAETYSISVVTGASTVSTNYTCFLVCKVVR